MPCDPNELRHVPLFELLDDDETAVLAAQVEIRQFAPRQRIFRAGDLADHGYVVMSGHVRLTTTDVDQQEVVVDEPAHGDFFGFASLLEQSQHQTSAMAMEETTCVEIGRDDLVTLLHCRPEAGIDMLTMQARQFHAAHRLVRSRANRNPNEVIEEQLTFGQRIADSVARFGGSWSFIVLFAVVLMLYSMVNVALKNRAWDPYPFILLNLFLSMLAAIQAPVIMMSQNRQDVKDRLQRAGFRSQPARRNGDSVAFPPAWLADGQDRRRGRSDSKRWYSGEAGGSAKRPPRANALIDRPSLGPRTTQPHPGAHSCPLMSLHRSATPEF